MGRITDEKFKRQIITTNVVFIEGKLIRNASIFELNVRLTHQLV